MRNAGKMDRERFARDLANNALMRTLYFTAICNRKHTYIRVMCVMYSFRRISYLSDQDEVYHYSGTDGCALPRISELESASGKRTSFGGKHVRAALSRCLSLLTSPSI